MRSRLLLVVFSLMGLISGCGGSGDSVPYSDQEELDQNMSTWGQAEITSYEYTYSKLCFCPSEGDIRIIVENGQITSAFYFRTGSPLSDIDSSRLFTIDELFAAIQEAILDGVAKLEVVYNLDQGYPESIYIDIDELIADEEITHFVSDLQ